VASADGRGRGDVGDDVLRPGEPEAVVRGGEIGIGPLSPAGTDGFRMPALIVGDDGGRGRFERSFQDGLFFAVFEDVEVFGGKVADGNGVPEMRVAGDEFAEGKLLMFVVGQGVELFVEDHSGNEDLIGFNADGTALSGSARSQHGEYCAEGEDCPGESVPAEHRVPFGRGQSACDLRPDLPAYILPVHCDQRCDAGPRSVIPAIQFSIYPLKFQYAVRVRAAGRTFRRLEGSEQPGRRSDGAGNSRCAKSAGILSWKVKGGLVNSYRAKDFLGTTNGWLDESSRGDLSV
jgi:hypothetical protein